MERRPLAVPREDAGVLGLSQLPYLFLLCRSLYLSLPSPRIRPFRLSLQLDPGNGRPGGKQ